MLVGQYVVGHDRVAHGYRILEVFFALGFVAARSLILLLIHEQLLFLIAITVRVKELVVVDDHVHFVTRSFYAVYGAACVLAAVSLSSRALDICQRNIMIR